MAGNDVLLAGEGKEIVGETVDVGEHALVERIVEFVLQPQDAALGTTAHGAADVGDASCGRSTGQDEEAEGRELGIDRVDLLFECLDHLGGDDALLTEFALRGVGGQIGTDHEEGRLYVGEELPVVAVAYLCGKEADEGVEFVDGTIRFQAIATFADTLTTYERGLAVVAGAGIEGRFHEKMKNEE